LKYQTILGTRLKIYALTTKTAGKNTNSKENKFEKLRKEIQKEKDPDIRAELKRGNIVEIIESSLDY
jgi:hypothetical protein